MSGPSRLAQRLLAAALPDASRGEIAGDLFEEHGRRAGRGALRAEAWYWAAGLALVASYWAHRLRGAFEAGSGHQLLPARGRVVDQVTHELRMALRGLLRRPAVSALVIATLAVGLAANAALFSAFDALVLRSMDYPHQERLVRAWQTSPQTDAFDRSTVSPADVRDWQAGASAFDALVGLEWWDTNVQGRELPERAQGFKVSPAFFDALGVVPALGRGFRADEGDPARRHVVVIGDGLWKRSFGADPGLLGQSVILDGEAFTVVGIAPPGFYFPEGAELWAPLVLASDAPRDRHYLSVVGRLAPGVPFEQGQAQLEALTARLAQDHPRTNALREAVVVDLQRGYEDPGLRGVMAIWQASALFLLLIACVNVANLTLARATERQGELAVRLALGAARGRIVRQLVAEGLVSAGIAAVVSVPLTTLATRAMREAMPAEIARFVPGWSGIDVDGRTLAFTLALGSLAMLAFSAWPAIRASRTSPAETLRLGGRGASGTRQRGRNLLVVAEVAAALTLVVGAGLAVRTAQRFMDGPLGFDPDRLLTFSVSLPEADYGADAQRRSGFVRAAEERLRELPGVVAVTAANVLPVRGSNSSRKVFVEGAAAVASEAAPVADSRIVSPTYFAAMGIPLTSGRELRASDHADGEPVAVVSRSFAQRHWPGQDPLGRRFRVAEPEAPAVTVVGVCGDVIHHWFARRDYPTFYRPAEQSAPYNVAFAVRTSGDPEPLADAARKAIAAVDPALPASDLITMRQAIVRGTIGLQFGAAVMGVIAVVALLLAVSGIYGVMAYRVALREGEFGVRMALGASARDLLGLTLRQASALAGIGVGIGLVFAGLLGQAMAGAFQGAVRPDAMAYVATPALLFAVALFAAWLPARAVLAVDPSKLLRSS